MITTPSVPLVADPTVIDTAAPSSSGPVRFEKSLVDRACLGDADALQTIVRQFIDPPETIVACEYLGTLGIQPFGLKSFLVLTPRRLGALRIGWFGYVLYQDAPLEYTVSGVVAQPSKLGLYLWTFFNTLVILTADFFLFALAAAISTALSVLALLLAPLALAAVWLMTVRMYYAINKCGMLWAVREGISVYAFTNRGRMNLANRLHRLIFEMRERRVREVSPMP
jgi:hypothetical protein